MTFSHVLSARARSVLSVWPAPPSLSACLLLDASARLCRRDGDWAACGLVAASAVSSDCRLLYGHDPQAVLVVILVASLGIAEDAEMWLSFWLWLPSGQQCHLLLFSD